MPITMRQVGPCFAAEVDGVDMTKPLSPERGRRDPCRHGSLRRAGLPRPADQRRAAARLHAEPGRDRARHRHEPPRRRTTHRLPTTFADVSNLDKDNKVFARDDRPRLFGLGNRLWHSDSSFKVTPAKYSLLRAVSIPSKGGNTEYADMRAGLRRARRGDQGRGRGPGLRALAALLAQHPRLHRLHRGGARALQAGAPVPRAHAPGHEAPVALPRLACGRHRRLAGARGARLPARPRRARHAAPVRLRPHVAGQRPRDVGQPRRRCTARGPSRRTSRATCAAPRSPETARPRPRPPPDPPAPILAPSRSITPYRAGGVGAGGCATGGVGPPSPARSSKSCDAGERVSQPAAQPPPRRHPPASRAARCDRPG